MNRYYDKVSAVMKPYWESQPKRTRSDGLATKEEMVQFERETQLHARILGLAGEADRELNELLSLIGQRDDADSRLKELVTRLRG